MLCAFSAHMGWGVLKFESQNRKCDGHLPVAHHRHNPHPGRVPERGRPVPAERLFACWSSTKPPNGPSREECLLPSRGKDSRCQSSASNSESAGYPPKLIAGICLGVHRPDWPSAIGRNPGFAPHTSPTWPVPPIDKPRCTYYLGCMLGTRQ